MHRHEAWVLCIGLMAFFLSISLLYQMAPFFQMYAEATTGASPAEIGAIYAVLPGTAFLCSVPAGKLIIRIGAKQTLVAGLMFLSLSSLMFGLSGSVRGWLFWRSLQGASTAAIYSAISCIFAKTFPEPSVFQRVNGLQQSVASVGFAVGPTLGGLLFQIGGFAWPFRASAIGHFIFAAVASFTPDSKPRSHVEEPLVEPKPIKHASIRDVLTAEVLVLLPAGVMVPWFYGAIDPVLAKHLSVCLGDIDSSLTGVLMSIPAYPSIVLNCFVPAMTARVSADWVVMIGLLMFAFVQIALALTEPVSAMSVDVIAYPEQVTEVVQSCVGAHCGEVLTCFGLRDATLHMRERLATVAGLVLLPCAMLGALLMSHWQLRIAGAFFVAAAFFHLGVMIADAAYLHTCAAYPGSIIHQILLSWMIPSPVTDVAQSSLRSMAAYPVRDVEAATDGFRVLEWYLALTGAWVGFLAYAARETYCLGDLAKRGLVGLGTRP